MNTGLIAAGNTLRQLCPKQYAAWADHMPGLVLHRKAGHSVETVVHGVSDVVQKTPITAETLFPIASVTKTYTAALLLKLEEKGLLSLSDKLAKHVPDDMLKGIANASDATLKQLLQHTSGIPEYRSSSFVREIIKRIADGTLSPLTLSDKLGFIRNLPAAQKLGERFAYSNTNYALLEPVIEKTTGLPLKEAFDKLLFTPLGFAPSRWGAANATTRGYGFRRELPPLISETLKPTHEFEKIANLGADGGLVATAAEVSQFFRALLHKQSYLKPKTVQAMLGDTVPVQEHIQHGLGIMVTKHPETGLVRYEYAGSSMGSQAYAAHAPSTGETLVGLANRSTNCQPHPNIGPLAREAFY